MAEPMSVTINTYCSYIIKHLFFKSFTEQIQEMIKEFALKKATISEDFHQQHLYGKKTW